MATSKTAPAAGRIRVLDAAELLFARNGFDGTALRDISRHAQVEVGLVPYHFGTKADLFRETLLRRAPAFAAALETALDDLPAGNAPLGVEAVLAAYLDAHIALVRSPEPGWRSYLRLAADAMLHAGKEELTRGATAIYRPVMQRYEELLVEIAGGVDAEETRRAWSIFRRSILTMLIQYSNEDPLPASELADLRGTCLAIFAHFLNRAGDRRS
jgi:AcrR family transcriptional regulator